MNIDVDVPHRGDAATSAQIPLTIVCTHRDRPTPCLDFHMKQCSAPCIGNVTPEDYRRNSIDGVVAFFEGKYKEVAETLKAAMREAAAAKKFEKAAMLRDHFTRMTELQEKQMMSDTSGENTDYIGVALRDNRASVVVLRERDGKVLDEQSFDLTGDADTTADVLGQFLPQYYDNVTEYPDCVVAAEAPDENHLFADWISSRKGSRVELRIPERGKKSSLLVLAEKNADLKVAQRITKWEVRAGGTDQALKDLAETLRLVSVPKRIEGYDISHLGGSFTVGSMVVLQNGVPKRDHYRSFSVRGLDGAIDDYASLKDVLTRRLKYLGVSIKEEEKLWKERGVTVGKAKKNDLHCIEETMKEEGTFELNDLAMKDFIVARHEETIVGFVRLFSHAEKLTELKSLWVHPNFRGQRLGRFLARKILQSRKKGKVYVTVDASLESYYADIGFRHVLHEPELFQKRLDAYHALCPPRGVTMMIEVAKQNIDPSFSVRPDLILIDGGKGQLGVAMDVLRDLHLAIPVASLAKREEEIFVPDSSDPVALPKNAPAQFLLQRLRDEAHRFANVIREKQGKNAMLQSGFDAVDGIGPKTRALLLKKFGSMDAAKQASDDELKRLLNTSQLKAFRKKLG
jgi:excinuclease UvrABC nuclease subunit